jgi:hypothetical protein
MDSPNKGNNHSLYNIYFAADTIPQLPGGFIPVLGRGHCGKLTDRYTESIAFEQEMDRDNAKKKTRKRQQEPSKPGNRFNPLHVDDISDVDDNNFDNDTTLDDLSSSSDDSEIEEITNKEVRDL